MAHLPALFVGSSSENVKTANAVQVALEEYADVTVWTQSFFQPGTPYIQALAEKVNVFDFALLIMDADDHVESRGTTALAPRDNVIFELGLFIGAIGRNRTFFMYNRDYEPKIPSDLSGVSALTYRNRSDDNLHAAIAPACFRLAEVLQRMGPREDSRLEFTLSFSGRPEDLSDEQRHQLKTILGMEVPKATVDLSAGVEERSEPPPPETQRFDIFLSHAGPDRAAAAELYDELTPRCRVFLDSKSLRLGDPWDLAIAEAQEASSITLVLISEEADEAYYQREEVARAIDRSRQSGHRVIPIVLDTDPDVINRTPYGLRLRKSISWQELGGAKGVAKAVLQTLDWERKQ